MVVSWAMPGRIVGKVQTFHYASHNTVKLALSILSNYSAKLTLHIKGSKSPLKVEQDIHPAALQVVGVKFTLQISFKQK